MTVQSVVIMLLIIIKIHHALVSKSSLFLFRSLSNHILFDEKQRQLYIHTYIAVYD